MLNNLFGILYLIIIGMILGIIARYIGSKIGFTEIFINICNLFRKLSTK